MNETVWQELKARLVRSTFRSRFRLSDADRLYIEKRGLSVIREHAARFVTERLAPAAPRNDGKQTPMRGHPVFVAQHATGACCRSCLAKWQGIPAGRELTAAEQARVVETLMRWIVEQAQPTGERTRDEIENRCIIGHAIGSQRGIGSGHELPQGQSQLR